MKRLDQYLKETNVYSSRAKAQDAIKQGLVFVNDICVQKCSFMICEEDNVEVKNTDVAFASRAGYKLYDVLDDFAIDLQNRIVIDVGASTGGFTDVCLKAGAAKVYAVDVGHDQLIDILKQHPKVVEMSGCNCRYLKKEQFDPLPNFACMDVSFISIKQILPVLLEIMENVEIVALVKPQFEAGKENVGKNGIVKQPKVHIQVLQDMIQFVESLGCYVHHVQASSILGRDGNKEFVIHIKKEPCQKVFPITAIVKQYTVKR